MNGLQHDTLIAIQETAVRASEATGKLAIVKPPQEPPHVYFTVKPNGDFERHDAIAAPRAHKLVTLAQVVGFVEHKGDIDGGTVVWFDRDGVTVIVDDTTRRDRADLKLSLTPQMNTLLALEKRSFSQREFRKLLRVDLRGCRNDDRVLDWISTVKFTDSRSAGGAIKQGKESLGREIEQAAVNSAGDCPEEMRLSVRVFDDPSLKDTWPVDCAVEIDLDNQAFQLLPFPLQLHDAIENEVGAIGEVLAGGVKCPVFRGKP